MVEIEVEALDLSRLSARIAKMLGRLREMGPFMRDAAGYMVRSTKFRVRQGHTAPDGSPLPALDELTVLLKGGNDKPLFQTGALHRSIRAIDVGPHGFTIVADPRDARGRSYAAAVQSGVKSPRGTVRTPDGRYVRPRDPIPARPFLGFSDENISRLAKLLRDHIERQD